MLQNLWRLPKENTSNPHQVRTCQWWAGWWWWQMTLNIPISSYWLILRKEIPTNFKLEIEWMQCSGLNTWVLPAKATDNRFLPTWWPLNSRLIQNKQTKKEQFKPSHNWEWGPDGKCASCSLCQNRACQVDLNSGALNKTTNGWGAESPKWKMELQHELPWTMLR